MIRCNPRFFPHLMSLLDCLHNLLSLKSNLKVCKSRQERFCRVLLLQLNHRNCQKRMVIVLRHNLIIKIFWLRREKNSESQKACRLQLIVRLQMLILSSTIMTMLKMWVIMMMMMMRMMILIQIEMSKTKKTLSKNNSKIQIKFRSNQ